MKPDENQQVIEEVTGDRPSFLQPSSEVSMTPDEHQQVVEELQDVIDDTQHTIDRFEATGMDEQMPEDYGWLLEFLDDAVKQQREHVMVMLLV